MNAHGPRLTENTVTLLETLLKHNELYPYALMREAKLPAGVVYPRLEVLTPEWLDVREIERTSALPQGRPMRTQLYSIREERCDSVAAQVAAARAFHEARAASAAEQKGKKRKRSAVPIPVLWFPGPQAIG